MISRKKRKPTSRHDHCHSRDDHDRRVVPTLSSTPSSACNYRDRPGVPIRTRMSWKDGDDNNFSTRTPAQGRGLSWARHLNFRGLILVKLDLTEPTLLSSIFISSSRKFFTVSSLNVTESGDEEDSRARWLRREDEDARWTLSLDAKNEKMCEMTEFADLLNGPSSFFLSLTTPLSLDIFRFLPPVGNSITHTQTHFRVMSAVSTMEKNGIFIEWSTTNFSFFVGWSTSPREKIHHHHHSSREKVCNQLNSPNRLFFLRWSISRRVEQ